MPRLTFPILLALAAFIAGSLSLPGTVHAQTTTVPAPVPAIPPIVWQLTSFPGGVIEQAGLYTVQFVPDGTVHARADCNWKTGVWSGGDGALDVTITMSTLAGCPEGSLEDAFVQALDATTSYVLDGFSLVLLGPTGEMHFTPALPAMA